MHAPYVFHGHDVSHFSGKGRPAFPQTSIWFREVLPDIREILRRTDPLGAPPHASRAGVAKRHESD